MTPRVRAAILAISAALCGAAWGWPRGVADPVAGIAVAATDAGTTPERVRVALGALLPARWSVEESGPAVTGRSVWALRGTTKRGVALAGFVTAVARRGHLLAWITVARAGEPLAEGDDHGRVGTFTEELFGVRESPGGEPLYPWAAEFVRRMRGPDERRIVSAWRVPKSVGHDAPITLYTDPASVEREGFVLVTLRPTSEPQIVAARQLADEVTALLATGAGIPAPRPSVDAAQRSAAFRSERPLTTGEVLLPEAVDVLQRAPRPAGFGVSALDARVRGVLDGPARDRLSVLLESDGTLLRAEVPRGGTDEANILRVPRGGEDPHGKLVWSGRLRRKGAYGYVGEVWELEEFAFEWRPDGR